MSDNLVFCDEPHHAVLDTAPEPWLVLIVDDEPGVHDVTKLVMSDFRMDGRPVQFLDCYSAAEAKSVLTQRSDIALILLDVVMENERAGLELARYIREDLRNLMVRIVLRTGQAGQAPEEQVIRDYDINDYKEKTELTRRKLITAFYAGLRAYRDLMRIEHARLGLRRSVEAITRVGDSRSLRSFASAVLEQLNFLLGLEGEGVCAGRTAAYSAAAAHGHITVLAATGGYSGLLVDQEIGSLPAEVHKAILHSMETRMEHHGARYFCGYYKTTGGSESVIYMQFANEITTDARELLGLFSSNVAITYEGLLIREEVERTQRQTISILAQAIERRSDDAAGHVQRVGDIAALLASRLGRSDRDIDLIRAAATLHDVGKIEVADRILAKTGALDSDEWSEVKTHCDAGRDLLSQSSCPMHQIGATIAHQHHEHWDGSGYPAGLAGDRIDQVARITALADVVDSLLCPSCYKPAWTLDAALAHVQAQRGQHFDPALVDLLVAERAAVESIYRNRPIGKHRAT